MRTEVVTVRSDDSVADLLDLLVTERLHGVPVVDGSGHLLGMVTQQDAFFASATRARPGSDKSEPLKVADIMTAPAVTAAENTDVRSLCKTMVQLRLHRVPITRGRRLTGIVSSLDVCEAVAQGADF